MSWKFIISESTNFDSIEGKCNPYLIDWKLWRIFSKEFFLNKLNSSLENKILRNIFATFLINSNGIYVIIGPIITFIFIDEFVVEVFIKENYTFHRLFSTLDVVKIVNLLVRVYKINLDLILLIGDLTFSSFPNQINELHCSYL